MTLIGWAEPPSYDKAAPGAASSWSMPWRAWIRWRRCARPTGAPLPAVDFNEGHRYTDYLPGKDKAATYGIAGLIVGATAAKAGFFKMIWLGIPAFKKLIVAGVIALVALVRRRFSGGGADAPTEKPAQ